jgi:hypothetical protein
VQAPYDDSVEAVEQSAEAHGVYAAQVDEERVEIIHSHESRHVVDQPVERLAIEHVDDTPRSAPVVRTVDGDHFEMGGDGRDLASEVIGAEPTFA